MINTAREFEPVLVANGRPADFIAQFAAAVAEVEQVLGVRGTLAGRQIGAKKGIYVMLRRGRRAVDGLDSVVRVAFEGNLVVLEKWRVAKRVDSKPVSGPTKQRRQTHDAPARVGSQDRAREKRGRT